MAGPDLGWGAGGLQAFQADQLNQQKEKMNDLLIQGEQTKLEQAQAEEQAKQRGMAILHRLSSGQTVSPADNPMAPVVGGGQPKDMGSALLQTANQLMQAGSFDTGMEFYKAGQQMLKDKADLSKTQLANSSARLKRVVDQSGLVGRELGNATTPDEWQQGLQSLEQIGAFTPEEIQNLKQIPFTQQSRDFLKQKAVSIAKQAQLQMDQAKQEQEKQFHEDSIAQQVANRQQREKIHEDNMRYKKTHEKTGTTARAPTTSALRSVDTAIRTNVLNGAKIPPDAQDAYDAAKQAIASRAQDLVKNNKGLDWQTAVNRAVLESKANGDWDFIKNDPFYHKYSAGVIGSSETDFAGFSRKGVNRGDAAPIPMGNDGAVQAGQLKKGKWYRAPDGRIGQWDGSKMTNVQ